MLGCYSMWWSLEKKTDVHIPYPPYYPSHVFLYLAAACWAGLYALDNF
jgi:hypothetical protein